MITALEVTRDLSVPILFHVSDRRVQCAIGSKKPETTVYMCVVS